MVFCELVWSQRKLLSGLEEDNIQGFPNNDISKSEILDMVCAIRSFENVYNTTKNGYEVKHVNWPSSTCQKWASVNTAMKQKGEDEKENKSEEGESNECDSRNMVLQCVDTLLDYVGQRAFTCGDTTAARKIQTAGCEEESNCSQ